MLSELAALVVCVCVLWCLERTCCCQCLLHLSYVLAICKCCGAWSTPGAVIAALSICVMFCGAWSASGDVSACCTCRMCWLYVCVVVLGVHLVL